ncbi:hypothetical protein F2P56_003708 [Juglans regia]|uniref:Protein PHYTOCHROME KINASE SUBSTRATE 3-like n=2 Tax=Juglans regia TaxID=51240 RepID=A0A2I4F4L3_JUGRE|nr:protein PHYTOCHROME KINASE SUBSTRATE 3-like [Juglans regia]KAF5477029.1 hypothetical protein F2P56_003708 [Juglans regia]
MDTEKNSTKLSNAAVSSYFSTAEEGSILKVAKLVQHLPPAVASSRTTPSSTCLDRGKTTEGEISVFRAERYFSMGLNNDSSKSIDTHGLKKDSRFDQNYREPKSRPGTPSIISEASWNSQAGLLPSFHRQPSQNTEKKVNGKTHFSGFICSRSCSEKKSLNILKHGGTHGKEVRKKAIQVDHNQFQPRSQLQDERHGPKFERSNREKSFSFPTISPGLQNLEANSQLKEEKVKEEEPRKSLEVFGSYMMKKGDIAMNLERKLSILTWDAIPKAQNVSTISGKEGMQEDVGSDASSDLFEIENLSCSEKQPQFTRQESDGMSSCLTSITKYEPSDASIEWSVVTASAARFSADTGFDEKKLEESNKIPGVVKTKSIIDKEAPKSRPSGLLGCKSLKALNVAETAHRTK